MSAMAVKLEDQLSVAYGDLDRLRGKQELTLMEL